MNGLRERLREGAAPDAEARSVGAVDPVVVAVGAAALAGGIHLAVAYPHFREHWTLGTFFLVLGLAQLALVPLLRRAQPAYVLLGVVGAHVGVLVLYVASRTVDLPFVPPHDVGHEFEHLPVAGGIGNGIPVYPGSRIEEVGLLDLLCLGAELALVAAVVSLLPARLRTPVTTVCAALAVVGLLLRGLVMTVW